MEQEIRILLVDDHSLFRDSLSRLLQTEPGFRIVGSCATVAEALPIILSAQADEQPDIILLDYDLGEEQGTVALDEIRRRGFKGRVLMVTAGMSDAATVRVLESGSEGIFLKHSSPRATGGSHPPAGGWRTLAGSARHAVPDRRRHRQIRRAAQFTDAYRA